MINYSFLRPLKATALKEWYEAPFEKKEELRVETYKNATILPLKRFKGDNLLFGRGGVVSENGDYINLSAIKDRVQFSYIFSNSSFVNENVVYCGYLVDQWGHFLIEAVARLWYFLKKDPSIDHYVFFVNENEKREISGNYQEFFKLLGIWDKISIINQPTRYKEVVIPELGYNRIKSYSGQFKEIFSKVSHAAITEHSASNSSTKHLKIFFSRSQLKNIKKREFGLEIIDNYFQKNGFTILYPEKVPLSELIVYIKKAEEIAMFSGSVHHNILFADDNKKIILIERNVINNEIQVDINRMKNLSVDYIDANTPIYTVNLSYGPFIMAYNKYLEQYTSSRKFVTPDSKYYSQKYRNKLFKKYMICYAKAYRFQWYMDNWCIKYTNTFREAYNESFQYFGDFLTGRKPFRLIHYFGLNFWNFKLQKLILFLYSKYHK